MRGCYYFRGKFFFRPRFHLDFFYGRLSGALQYFNRTRQVISTHTVRGLSTYAHCTVHIAYRVMFRFASGQKIRNPDPAKDGV